MATTRQYTKRAAALRAGDRETFDRLAPPSERKLSDAERCGALTKGGTPCRQRRGASTDHPGYGNCAKHGGCTEAGTKSAMKEMGQDLISTYKAEYTRFGGNRHDPSIASMTPESALLEEVRRSAAMVRFLEERIAAWNLTPVQTDTLEAFVEANPKKPERLDPTMRLQIAEFLSGLSADDPDSSTHLPALTQTNARTGLTGYTDAREWLYLYREERGHLARVAKMALDAGVASRLVTLAEDQGRIMATAIRAVLSALSLTPAQSALIPQIVPPILRAVASDSPIPDITSLLRSSTSSPAEIDG